MLSLLCGSAGCWVIPSVCLFSAAVHVPQPLVSASQGKIFTGSIPNLSLSYFVVDPSQTFLQSCLHGHFSFIEWTILMLKCSLLNTCSITDPRTRILAHEPFSPLGSMWGERDDLGVTRMGVNQIGQHTCSPSCGTIDSQLWQSCGDRRGNLQFDTEQNCLNYTSPWELWLQSHAQVKGQMSTFTFHSQPGSSHIIHGTY